MEHFLSFFPWLRLESECSSAIEKDREFHLILCQMTWNKTKYLLIPGPSPPPPLRKKIRENGRKFSDRKKNRRLKNGFFKLNLWHRTEGFREKKVKIESGVRSWIWLPPISFFISHPNFLIPQSPRADSGGSSYKLGVVVNYNYYNYIQFATLKHHLPNR